MDSDRMQVIIRKTFVESDLSKLGHFKSGTFWKEQLFAAVNLIPGVGGAIVQEIESIGNAKDAELFRKFSAYIFGVASTDTKSRYDFAYEIEQKAHDNAGSILMGMIDRLDNINKETILANLTTARIHGRINMDDFFRLSSLLERIPFTDLEYLPRYIENYYDPSGDTELLYATGALQQSVIDSNGEDKYVLSKLGRMLLMHGLMIQVESEAPSIKKEINATNGLSWEEVGEVDDIDFGKVVRREIEKKENEESDRAMFDLDVARGK